jgi:hypothetical protein
VLFWSLDRFSREGVAEAFGTSSGSPATASIGGLLRKNFSGALARSVMPFWRFWRQLPNRNAFESRSGSGLV